MTPPPDPDPYYLAIEEAFNRRRGAPLLLSPRDWTLIGEWKRAGVPLRIALLGIENVFDAFARRTPGARRINSLSYCRQEVLGLHELYLGLHGPEAGRPADAAPPDPGRALARHLARLSRRLKESLAAASAAGRDRLVGPIAEAAAEIRRIRRALKTGPLDPAAIEPALERLDAGLVASARASLDAAAIAALEAEADAAIGAARDRMTATALESTRHAALARILRSHAGIPRLSLFD
jgi:hypothetical protein